MGLWYYLFRRKYFSEPRYFSESEPNWTQSELEVNPKWTQHLWTLHDFRIMLDQFLFAVHWCHRWRSALCAFRLHQLAVTPDGAVLALQLKRTTPTNQMNHDDDDNTTMRGDGRWGHPLFFVALALPDPGAKETTGAHQIILRPLCIVQSTTGLTLNRIIQRLKCVELERAFIFQCRIGWYKLSIR